MKKEAVFLLKVFCGLVSVHLGLVLWPLTAEMSSQYGIIDPLYLIACGMLLAAPPLIAENW